jgi:hypothetical protein
MPKYAGYPQSPQAPGAFAFFIGDENGGTGWEVKLPDGSVETYYIEPPSAWQVDTGLVLFSPPQEYRQTNARELVAKYLDQMESIIADAKKKFG